MSNRFRIAVIGDYSDQIAAHVAIPKAVQLAANNLGRQVEPVWLGTASLGAQTDFSGFSGFWCAPGSPYANMEGALHAIRFARENNFPFLGTCGGFQHAIIEYARNVLGKTEADHAESNPRAELPLVSPLKCSLVGATGSVRLKPGSRAATLYGAFETEEAYNCSYGVNPRFRRLLENGDLEVTGWDDEQEVRVVELRGSRFFIGTLFQPERSALKGRRHPLITGFIESLTGVS